MMNLRKALVGMQYALEGFPAMRVWQEYEKRQWLKQADFDAYCSESLRTALEFACQHVPYYRSRSCTPQIESFPPLERLSIWAAYEELKSDVSGQPGEYVSMSSGSSGRQVSVLCDRLERAARLAVTWRGDSFPGSAGRRLNPWSRTVALWGFSSLALDRQSLRRRLATWVQNRTYFDCLVMTPEKARFIHRELLRLRPERITGYVHALALFSRLALELGLPRIRADKLIPSAEWLDPQSRGLIEQMFDAPIRERYGCREAGDIAHQCEHGVWHVNADHLFLEVQLADGRIAREGSGRLLVTKLSNRVMPVVRYDIEDMATLGGPPCRCGRALPVMQEISGRITSHFVLPDGTLLSQFTATIPFHHVPVLEWQVRQETATDVLFLVVAAGGFTDAHREEIISSFANYHHGQFRVRVELVPEIPLAPSGKRVLVYNQLLERQPASHVS